MNPLIPFTLLVQFALGAVALAALAPLRVGTAAEPLALRLLWIAAGALLAGTACSLGHLGVRAGALRALRNLRTSWLSREVLFVGLFTGLTLACAVAATFGLLPTSGLCWLAMLTGLAAVYTMARLYQATIHPAWTTPYTLVGFFATALLLGAALGAPLVAADRHLPTAAAGLLLRDMLLTAGIAGAISLGTGARPGLDRFLLLVGGLLLLAVGWYGGHTVALFSSAVLLTAGELLTRIRFFAVAD